MAHPQSTPLSVYSKITVNVFYLTYYTRILLLIVKYV